MTTPPERPVAQPLDALAGYTPGTVVSRMLLRNASGSATLFAFAAGEAFREHATAHDALIVVLNGEAAVTLDGETHRVRAGEAFRFPADTPHAVEAATDMRMLLVVLRNDPPVSHAQT